MRRETGLSLVDVGDGERAARQKLAAADRDVFRHRAAGNPPDHRHVVGAVDCDSHHLTGAAVGRNRGEAVGNGVGGAKLLNRGLAVVGAVGPGTVRGERECAIAVAAAGTGLRRETRLVLINVGDGERATGRQVIGDNCNIFRNAAGDDAADHRHVIGAVDGDSHHLAGGAVE